MGPTSFTKRTKKLAMSAFSGRRGLEYQPSSRYLAISRLFSMKHVLLSFQKSSYHTYIVSCKHVQIM